MEAHFRTDFREVRVHDNPSAARAAESIQPEAYTVGRDIYFGAGRYRPETEGGNHLLAHELTHVEQQTAGKEPFEGHVSPSARFIIGSSTDRLEQEAESKADSFSRRSKSGGVPTPITPVKFCRAEWNSRKIQPDYQHDWGWLKKRS